MKRLLLSATLVVLLFTSCEKFDSEYTGTTLTDTTLTDTTWKSVRIKNADGSWYQDELTFTSTHATYVRKTDYGSTGGPFTGTYSFDPPTVIIETSGMDLDGSVYVHKNEGTVKRKTMKIGIMTGDIVWDLELTKQ